MRSWGDDSTGKVLACKHEDLSSNPHNRSKPGIKGVGHQAQLFNHFYLCVYVHVSVNVCRV